MSDEHRELLVELAGEPIGVLRKRGDVTSFVFLEDHLNRARRPALGQVFEEAPRRTWTQKARLPPWFSNLLPEDQMRQMIAEELEVNPANEFGLLEALGADLPGALSLRKWDGLPPDRSDNAPSAPSEESLDSMIRFSLAGVQIKLSMVWSSNTLTLPGVGTLGDWLVKLPSARYRGVPENEYSMMRWAGACGLDVPQCDLRKGEELGEIPSRFRRAVTSNIYVVKRFDRRAGHRVHMEDFNQILNGWPDRKYEGAGHERLGLLVLHLCGEEDFLEYIRRLVFCIGIGNEDAHLKNWSVLYEDPVLPRLSPVYDLVSTVQYGDLTRGLALKFGDDRDMAKFDRSTFERLARKVGFSSSGVLHVVDETLAKMAEAWASMGDELPIDAAFRERLEEHQRSVPLLAPLV